MPRPAQHAAARGPQREDVAGAGQIVGQGRRVGQRSNRCRPVVGAGSGVPGDLEVDRHREGGAVGSGVVGDHHRDRQLFQPLFGSRGADQARGRGWP